MLKSIACVLIFLTVYSEATKTSLEKTSEFCFSSQKLPAVCSESNKRIVRSIETPISDIYNKLAINEEFLKCDNESHVINVVKASMSNKNSMCGATENLNSKECDEKILPFILANKLCTGKNKCDLSIKKNFGKICECSTQKYLEITFSCVDKTHDVSDKQSGRSKRYIRLNYRLKNQYNDDGYEEHNDGYRREDYRGDGYRKYSDGYRRESDGYRKRDRYPNNRRRERNQYYDPEYSDSYGAYDDGYDLY